MTAKEIFELRKQGRKEEAYEEARLLYATDKSGYASAAMFVRNIRSSTYIHSCIMRKDR